MNLDKQIEKYFGLKSFTSSERKRAITCFNELVRLLNTGNVRAAEKVNGEWKVNHWVKKGILLGFKIGKLKNMSVNRSFRFFDKDTLSLKPIKLNDGIRLVPGGSSVRNGSYVAPGVICMPPMYINIGAYVDEGSLIDSHALVGSCAQLGRRIHLSAAAQIGGVLEPVNSLPVIIEDDVMIGGNSGIYEGTIVKRRAVIAAGCIITGSTPVYDIVNNKIYRRTEKQPLIIPEGAVVVPGSRSLKSEFCVENNLSVYTPLIIKYRDEKTDSATALEDALR